MLPLSISPPSRRCHHHPEKEEEDDDDDKNDDDDNSSNDDRRPLFVVRPTTRGDHHQYQHHHRALLLRVRQLQNIVASWRVGTPTAAIIVTRYYRTTLCGLFTTTLLIFYLVYRSPLSLSSSYYDDPYAKTPFCHARTGYCGEQADLASARTVYSAQSADQYRYWYEYQLTLQKETNTLLSSLSSSSSSSHRKNDDPKNETTNHYHQHLVLFYGDSITEALRGTAYGRPCHRCQGLASVAQEVLATTTGGAAAGGAGAGRGAVGRGGEERTTTTTPTTTTTITPLFLGISGDQTQHVLYRIAQSAAALSDLLLQLSAKSSSSSSSSSTTTTTVSFVVLIGTNNLSVGISPRDTADGILAVAAALSELITDHHHNAAATAGIGTTTSTNSQTSPSTTTTTTFTTGRIVLLHVLPRGDDERLQNVCPTQCQYNNNNNNNSNSNNNNNNNSKKNNTIDTDHSAVAGSALVVTPSTSSSSSSHQLPSSFMPWIVETNGYLIDQQQHHTLPPHVELLNCNGPFYDAVDVTTNTSTINEKLFIDRLHPNDRGTRRLMECVRDHLLFFGVVPQ